MLARFWNNREGGVAPLLAIAILPLMGAVGAAVDYGRASALRTAMQGAIDSTALQIVERYSSDGTITAQAPNIFSALFERPEVLSLDVTADVTVSTGETIASLSASGYVNTTFMRLMGFSTLKLKVQAKAAKNTDESGCVLALNPTASGAVSAGGSTNIALNNCSVYSNSSDAAAFSAGGSATVSALSIGTVGKVSISGANITTSEGINTDLSPIADPYNDVAFPSFSGCTKTNLIVTKPATIDPGVYCKGISVNAGAILTLNPGVYYLDRGSMTVNGGATITGNGVTLVFTSSTGDNWATATINGNATVNLTAPIAGPTAGIVVFGDRGIPAGTSYKFNGSSTQYLGGAVYVPTGAVSYSGGAGTSTACTQIIGGTVDFTGNAAVAINCSGYHTRPFGRTSIRLIM